LLSISDAFRIFLWKISIEQQEPSSKDSNLGFRLKRIQIWTPTVFLSLSSTTSGFTG